MKNFYPWRFEQMSNFTCGTTKGGRSPMGNDKMEPYGKCRLKELREAMKEMADQNNNETQVA